MSGEGGSEECSQVGAGYVMLTAMDNIKKRGEWRREWNQPANGLECAIFDYLCHSCDTSLAGAIGESTLLPSPSPSPSFYTVSISEDMDTIASVTRFGLTLTPYLKIKLNDDLALCKRILNTMESVCASSSSQPVYWAIDANAAWSAAFSRQFLDVLASYRHRVIILEQPFPVSMQEVSDVEQKEWKLLKEEVSKMGIRIFADESVRVVDDVDALSPFCHGVNVKLDKAGGIRGGLEALLRARELGLELWVGIMVSSTLSCSYAAHLHCFTSFGDLDGEELLKLESQPFTAGYVWNHSVEEGSKSGGLPGMRDLYADAAKDGRAYGKIEVFHSRAGCGALVK
mmetsp:Transcript_27014/g.69488  ORF Transcript_27014/g.69488 Transcript_27014/m.69488 type:complete len:342 (-) Transcript_27014:19-1044(-)